MASEPERSIAAVLKDIVGNLQQILRAELRLAAVEVRQEVDRAKRGVALLIVGGAVALLAVGFVFLAGMYLLETIVGPWIAALIVASAAGGIGGAFVAAGVKQMRQVALAPPRAVAHTEERVQWARTSTK